ncbi:MAG: CPBP family intramembrane metalloprotease [Ruminococcus sp.]|nr:CPBP family intramembrane metalloprotease [Ruminococcus sp.]
MSAENNTTGQKIRTLLISYGEVCIMLLIGQILGMFIMGFISGILNIFISDIDTSDIWETAVDYGSFIGIWLVTLLFLKLKRKKRPILQAVGTKPDGNNIFKFLFGILIGFALNGVCILVAWLHGDIVMHFESFRPLSFVFIFAMVLIQSSAEELTCRGFLYQILIQRFKSPAVAILGNSLLFASLHLGNNGITVLSFVDICLSGILFSLMVYYMDSLWCAFAGHTAWNFTQAIIFGLPNSGNPAVYSVFKIDLDNSKNSFAYNVIFGIEGTVLSVIVLALACMALYLWGRKYGKKPYNIWEENNELVTGINQN